MKKHQLLALVLALLVLTGCGGPTMKPANYVPPTPGQTPAMATPDPVLELTPTPEPIPTFTPESTPSPTLDPTPTPSPSVVPSSTPINNPPYTAPPPPAPPRTDVAARARLGFIGDILPHKSVYEAARISGGYDFTPHFASIAPLMVDDYLVANLEVPVSGGAPDTYPCFNSPPQLLDAMRDVLGVNLTTRANNHSLDQGLSGLKATDAQMQQRGMEFLGSYGSQELAGRLHIATVNGIKIGFLAATDVMNIGAPGSAPWCVDKYNAEAMRNRAAQLKAAGAEYIIALIHWGNEYVQPTNTQKNQAAWLFANTEINAIVGHHPHIVQPIAQMQVQGPNGPKVGTVVYSLGNFLAGQSTQGQKVKSGLYVRLTIERYNDGTVGMGAVEYLPTYIDVDNNYNQPYRVVSIPKALADHAAGADHRMNATKALNMRTLWDEYKVLMQGGPAVLLEG